MVIMYRRICINRHLPFKIWTNRIRLVKCNRSLFIAVLLPKRHKETLDDFIVQMKKMVEDDRNSGVQ